MRKTVFLLFLILSMYGVSPAQRIQEEYKIRQNILHNYPEYLGGDYIDENGCHVFVVVGDTISARKDLERRLKGYPFLIVRGKYTLSELMIQKDSIVNKLTENNNHLLEELGIHGVSIVTDSIVISMEDTCEIKFSLFRQYVSDFPAIFFRQEEASESQ